MIFELVQPGQVIAHRTPPEEKQSFYLVVVNEVITAASNVYDAYQHFVTVGDRYLSCCYLEIERETKTYIQYKKQTTMVLVLPGEVLTPFVNISDDFKLSLDEKQWLCDSA